MVKVIFRIVGMLVFPPIQYSFNLCVSKSDGLPLISSGSLGYHHSYILILAPALFINPKSSWAPHIQIHRGVTCCLISANEIIDQPPLLIVLFLLLALIIHYELINNICQWEQGRHIGIRTAKEIARAVSHDSHVRFQQKDAIRYIELT